MQDHGSYIDVKNVLRFLFTARFYVLTMYLLFTTFFLLKTEKWPTHSIKRQIKMTFSFVMQ